MNRLVGLWIVTLLITIIALLPERSTGDAAYRITVPTTGAGWNDGANRNQEVILRESYRVQVEILAEIRELKEALKTRPVQDQPINLGQLVGEKCVVCHNTKDAAKNANLSLVNEMSEITDQELGVKKRIHQRIDAGSMPPPKSGIPPLTAQEKIALKGLWK